MLRDNELHPMLMAKFRDVLRPVWHKINPCWLTLRRRAERRWIWTRTLPATWLRHEWPLGDDDGGKGLAIAAVNYNTAEDISHLLFSLFRVLGRDQFERVVVVDNGSSDDSPALLTAMAEAGAIDVVFNKKQRFHGPGVNQAMAHLARMRRGRKLSARHVWVLDSDVIVLRPDTVRDALQCARDSDAALLGQIAFDEIQSGYAHISCLLLDAAKVWRRSFMPFEESGTPAYELHRTVRRRKLPIVDFPFRTENYVLHVTSRTLAQVFERGEVASKYYSWAAGGCRLPFHGNPDGDRIYRAFLDVFDREVGRLTPDNLVAACRKEELVAIAGIEPRRGDEAAAFTVTGVVDPRGERRWRR